MTIKTALSCPLGSKCEEIRDDTIHRCAWFIQLAGQDPNTGEARDEKGCAMAWMPVLLVENARQHIRTTAAVESFRNEAAEQATETRKIMVVAHALMRPPQLNTIPPGQDQTLIGG
jgi:hypothetical protein